MGKQGMGRRIGISGPGLLGVNRVLFTFIFLLFLVFQAASQSGDAGDEEQAGDTQNEDPVPASMDALALVSPQNPVSSGNLTITIMTDHPVPSEVTVRPPRFPAGLVLERVRTESRFYQKPRDSDESGTPPEPSRWTAVEFLFTAVSPGSLVLDPFEVSAPGKKAATETVRLRISEDTRSVRRNAYVFRWEHPPASLEAGMDAELVLALGNWDNQKPPPFGFFRGRLPTGAIMEELPFSEPGSDGIIRYRFRIIPLTIGSAEERILVLEPFSMSFDGNTLEIPGLSIKIAESPNSPETSVPAQEELLSAVPVFPQEENTIADAGIYPFTGGGEEVFPLFRKEYERIRMELESLWEDGKYAKALAELRKNERENFAGPALAPLRRQLEKNLGLSPGEDEKWQIWKIPAFSVVFVLILLGIIAGFLKIRVTFGRQKGYKSVVFLVTAGMLAVLFLLGGLGDRSGSGQKAVLEKTLAYRVPDIQGTISARFGEGQPVYVRSVRGEWVYAESADGRAGWIPAEAVIPY